MTETRKRKHVELTVDRKAELIRFVDAGHSHRQASQIFNISKATVSNIVAEREKWLRLTDAATTVGKERRRKVRVTRNAKVNEAIWLWFRKLRSTGVSITGPILQATARKFAERFGISDFQASNGWLQCFTTSHGLSHKSFSDECQDSDFYSLADAMQDFKPADVFTAEEIGMFYRILPRLDAISLATDVDDVNERLTVLLCASTLGEKLPPLVIGNTKKPAGMDVLNSNSGFTWRSNRNSVMTLELFYDWLQQVNVGMRQMNRHILLLVSACSAHNTNYLDRLSHVTVLRAPSDVNLPLQQGVIRQFKTLYRRFLLEHSLHHLDDVDTNCACSWVEAAWHEMDSADIRKCYQQAGIHGNGMQPSCSSFVKLEMQDSEHTGSTYRHDEAHLDGLIARFAASAACEVIPAADYVAFDDAAPRTETIDCGTLINDIIADLNDNHNESENCVETESETVKESSSTNATIASASASVSSSSSEADLRSRLQVCGMIEVLQQYVTKSAPEVSEAFGQFRDAFTRHLLSRLMMEHQNAASSLFLGALQQSIAALATSPAHGQLA